MQLYRAEVPGPVPDNSPAHQGHGRGPVEGLHLFSAAQTVLLMFGGMNLFDALCHTFGTMATGGFSTRNALPGRLRQRLHPVGGVNFMLLAGINFSLHYKLLLRRFSRLEGPELGSSSTLPGRLARGLDRGPLRYRPHRRGRATPCRLPGLLHPDHHRLCLLRLRDLAYVTQALLVGCMFVGGSAGSTRRHEGHAPGAHHALGLHRASAHHPSPRSLHQVKFGGRVVSPELVSGIWGSCASGWSASCSGASR